MPPPTSSTLKKLPPLDTPSPNFQSQLDDLLRGKEYQECAPSLEGDDLVWLVDYLDKALGPLDPSSPASQRCLRELRTICGAKAILPTSYNLFSITSPAAAASGDCDVHKGTYLGSNVGVKSVRTDAGPQAAAKLLYQEAAVWKHLVHNNISPFKGATTNPIRLISDWMPGGNLPEYIKNNPGVDRLKLLSDAAAGLSYLHSRNVIHGNLKGSNIVVDAGGHARITDFRLATVSSDADSEQTTPGQSVESLLWSAPEVLEGGATSKETDIFSFAMVMIEVFTETTPQPVVGIARGERPSRPTNPSVTGGLWRLIKRCWDKDPESRPKASEVLQILRDSNPPAWKQLIDPASTGKRIDLIKTIFSDRDEVEVFKYLSKDDAQAFVHVIGEAVESVDDLPQDVRRRFLRSSYRVCRREASLPTSFQISLCYKQEENPDYQGGLADVWKGQYGNLRIAAKALRISKSSDHERIRKWFFKEVLIWKALRHPNVLPLVGVTVTESPHRLVMVTGWMENGNINKFLKAHPDANRLKLLQEVTQGLVYLHARGVVHGDIKGDNILIDNNKHAILADFSLITLIPDQQSFASTCLEGGTVRWMSPELMDPEKYDLKRSCPTSKSDCYALGMVIYEILGECAPYNTVNSFAVLRKVLAGERPEKPKGEAGKRFTTSIWEVVNLCWDAQPEKRPDAGAVLLALGGKPDQPGVSGDAGSDAESDVGDQLDDVIGSTDFRPW